MTGPAALRLIGPSVPDDLDPATAHHDSTRQLTRLFARCLFGYRAEPNLRDWQAIAPLPDLAVDIPSTYNTGMGARHVNNVVHLRPGIVWDATPPRPVTAHDVVRGLKRLGNPVLRPAALPCFTSTIRGMAEFCEGYRAALGSGEPSARDLADYQNSHDIPGVFLLDDESLVIELTRPALDFAHLMAMPCAAPAPVEYDAYIPGSPEMQRNLRSNGPYRPAGFQPGELLRFSRNPRWARETDPIRGQGVDAIEVLGEHAVPAGIEARIRSGTADLAWDGAVADPSRTIDADPGYALDPYLVFNLHSPNSGGAVGERDVRFAIACAVDKTALLDLHDEHSPGTTALIARGVVPPGDDVHQELDPHGTPGARSEADQARAALAAASRDTGLILRGVHSDDPLTTVIARSCAHDLAAVGIVVEWTALPRNECHRVLGDPGQAHAGRWDLALAARAPAWPGAGGRGFLQTMFETNDSPGTGNCGRYCEPAFDRLVDQALGAVAEPARARAYWQAAERQVLADVAVVPLLFRKPLSPQLHAARVQPDGILPAAGYTLDLSLVRLVPSP
ncbi:ABC transporter substrate-binding protein [Amycolatopsis silviterrae]|uniref:ABC transporter substrate-binding protein n=1 Tax=Amycolatopsis silviterrae TaxID=1656914 RepID=A0ABW5HGJ4_9PSEU